MGSLDDAFCDAGPPSASQTTPLGAAEEGKGEPSLADEMEPEASLGEESPRDHDKEAKQLWSGAEDEKAAKEAITKVLDNPKTATVDDVYYALEAVPFPEGRIRELLPDGFVNFLTLLQGALQIPFATVLLSVVGLASFAMHRTVAMYTPMLGVPPLPWVGVVGRTGEGKSLAIWFQKECIKELQKRAHRREVKAARAEAAEARAKAAEDVHGKSSSRRRRKVAGPALEKEDEGPALEEAPMHGAGEDGPVAEEHDDGSEAEEASAKRARKTPTMKKFTVDGGTILGWGPIAQVNEGRVYAALHEGKQLLHKVTTDAPGCDPQSLNKLYDRDEFSNSVLSAGSKFQVDQPWILIWMALHLEDLREIYAGGGKDPLGTFARFDFFARKGHVPTLDEYNELEQDEAIMFVADILELCEANFPTLDDDPDRARQDPHYSTRTKLWRIFPSTEFFTNSFNTHALSQRAAKERKDEKRASFEGKTKTKEIRYTIPIDAPCKAYVQKERLDAYRKEKINQCKDEEAALQAFKDMDILDLRDHFAHHCAEEAQEVGLPQWGLAPSEASSEVGHLIMDFLASEAQILGTWLHGVAVTIGPPATGAAGKENGAAPGAVRAYGEAELDELLAKSSNERVHRVGANAQVLLKHGTRVFKIKDTKRALFPGLELDMAVSLLVAAGLMKTFAWKRPGTMGYKASYLAKRDMGMADQMLKLEVANMMRQVFRVSFADFASPEGDGLVEDMDEDLYAFPDLNVDSVRNFARVWAGRAVGSPSVLARAQGAAAALVSRAAKALSPGKPASAREEDGAGGSSTFKSTLAGKFEAARGKPGAAGKRNEYELDPKRAEGMKSQIKWILCNTSKNPVQKTYLKGRARGFDADSDEFEALLSVFGALGLAQDTTRGGGAGSFSLVKPAVEDDVENVCTKLGEWLQLKEEERSSMKTRIGLCAENQAFKKSTFDFVIENIRTQTGTAPITIQQHAESGDASNPG